MQGVLKNINKSKENISMCIVVRLYTQPVFQEDSLKEKNKFKTKKSLRR